MAANCCPLRRDRRICAGKFCLLSLCKQGYFLALWWTHEKTVGGLYGREWMWRCAAVARTLRQHTCVGTVSAAVFSRFERCAVSRRTATDPPPLTLLLVHSSTMATTIRRKRKADINPYDQALPFTFDLPDSHLVLVDCPSQFRDVASVLASARLMGIDTETRPNFVAGQKKNRTALLQMAVRTDSGDERVYIFDLLKLLPKYATQLDNLLQASLADRAVVKLGQELCADMSDLGTAYPTVACFRNVQSILEVNAIAKILQPQQTHAIGLKQLTKTYLNYNLVKSQQMSNWAKRPLTPNQIHYAACDALVLIRLYDAMTMEVADLFGEYDFASCYKNYERLPHEEEEAAKRKQKQRRHSQSPKKLAADAATSETATTASECSESTPSEAETGTVKKRKAA